MVKSSESNRFPQSANLFKFCLRVLEARRGARIHDQEVGNILGFNPSDTSHWKRGKKAVRNVNALELVAKSLGVGSELIHDVADGSLEIDEAWFEFDEAEELKKMNESMTPALIAERHHRVIALESVATEILAKAKISSFPVFVPELLAPLENFYLVQIDIADKLSWSSKGTKPGTFKICARKGETNPQSRAAIAKEIARVILHTEREKWGLMPRNGALEFMEIGALAHALLVPRSSFVAETQAQSARLDIVKGLSEIFWVPKSVIRSRMKQIVLSSLGEDTLSQEPLVLREISGGLRRSEPSLVDFLERPDLLAEDSSAFGEKSSLRREKEQTGGTQSH